MIKVLVQTAIALLGGGLTYAGWMAIFLMSKGRSEEAPLTLLWLLAPAITALGFALGLWVCDSFLRTGRRRAAGYFLWPFVGCSMGAGIVFWLLLG